MGNSQQDNVVAAMETTLHKLKTHDTATLALLNGSSTNSLAHLTPEARRKHAIDALTSSIKVAKAESVPQNHEYHSRDPLTGLIQSGLESKLEDNVLPELQAFGQGNPVVWIPAGILGILEHARAKYPFITASEKSQVVIPNKCKVALLGDWGADNDHAKRLGKLAIEKGADYVVHLGDIYYSGTEAECKTFLKNWPLTDADGLPTKGKSFALNGNHEMYSLGRPFFTNVLPAFGQEASYFTLANDFWQFQGLDTAYVPFTIGGSGKFGAQADSNLQPQYDWLLKSISESPKKANIFLSHNQPVSAHMPEFQAAQPLMNEVREILGKVGGTAIYAWFFGHEHRCTIYDDKARNPDALFRARLIGNGSIAHHPQEEVKAAKDETGATTTPFLKVNTGSLDKDQQVAISTFALLTLDGGTIHVDYLNEDGSLFYEENWDYSKKLW